MDEQPKKKPMSEIGHLFLSSVRDQHLGGLPLPQRVPPGRAQQPQQPGTPHSGPSIDLTADEYAQVFEAGETAGAEASVRRTPPMTAVISEHLNGKQLARVKDYARHLAASAGGRVGLIAVDSSEFRLMCFEPGEQQSAAAEQATDCYDPRMMAEAIEEMNFDVDRWLVLIPSPRAPEAQPLLRLLDHWVVLSTCDHDGIVSSYRVLKGLPDVHRPRLSLALLDSGDARQAERVHAKLAGVCQQFLDRSLEAEPPVRKEYGVCEHVVMLCRATRDKAQLANAPQWAIVADFLARTRTGKTPGEAADSPMMSPPPAQREMLTEVIVPTVSGPVAEVSTSQAVPAAPEPTPAASHPAEVSPMTRELPEVLELPSTDATAEQIVLAVLKQESAAMLECPVRPPMCAEARLAVTRDRELVLLAVARRGLNELQSIGQAYRWLADNRTLIGMAMPQLAIDASRTPRLRLLVEQCDAGAEMLQPMLTGEHVAVQSYRRVRWGSKAGLLLQAA